MATPGPQATSLALVDVARFLLQEGYLLSALELHQELLETGVDLPILKKEFRELKPRQSKQPPKKLGKPDRHLINCKRKVAP